VEDGGGREAGRGMGGAGHVMFCWGWLVVLGQEMDERVGRGGRSGF